MPLVIAPVIAALAAEVPVDALVAGSPPVWSGAGTASACGGPAVTLGGLVDGVGRVERALANLRTADARAELDALHAALPCLTEPAAAGVVSRIPYLRGIVATLEGADAEPAFVAALVAQPDLAWDDRFPPDGRPAFERARAVVAGLAAARVTLLPAPPTGATWLDGRVAAPVDGVLTVLPGEHLLQVAGRGWVTRRIVVPAAGEATLLRPDEFPADAWLADAEGREALAVALAGRLPAGTPVRVPDGDAAWTLRVGDAAWVHEAAPRRAIRGRWLAFTGGGVLAGAIAGGAIAWAEMRAAEREMASAKKVSTFEEARARGETAAGLVAGAQWVAGGGLALVGAGLAIEWVGP
ncbi:MAG: hypothetical protein ACOZNI_09300 [Myxococcota bacterium]